ncbi:MAG: hypothetical protein AAFW89_05710 [Bacteroidota bacterium]
MTSQALSTPSSSKSNVPAMFVVPMLDSIKQQAKADFAEMQQAFDLLGWSAIPDRLKIEIYDDVKGMIAELKGRYCTSDEFVQRRRNTVHFWISCYQDGTCNLDAAVDALKIKAL